RLLADGNGAFEKWFGLCVAALAVVLYCEGVEAVGHVGVLGAQRLLADGNGALQEWLGLCVAGFVPVEQSQILNNQAGNKVARAEHLLDDRQLDLVDSLRLSVPTLGATNFGKQQKASKRNEAKKDDQQQDQSSAEPCSPRSHDNCLRKANSRST